MKIMLLSAGTKKGGATERAVKEAQDTLLRLGAEFETFNLYTEEIHTCSGCGYCKTEGECVHKDKANDIGKRVKDFDGYIFFTPVHYGGASGSIKCALGRIFMSQKKNLIHKPASAVSVSRRGGNFTAVEEITRFFAFASMPAVNGNYMGIAHGISYEEAENDKEGLQTVRSICKNTVWLIKCIEAGKNFGILPYPEEAKIKTSFIR